VDRCALDLRQVRPSLCRATELSLRASPRRTPSSTEGGVFVHGIPVNLCVCRLSRHCGCSRQ
jgi:hypothetical protein